MNQEVSMDASESGENTQLDAARHNPSSVLSSSAPVSNFSQEEAHYQDGAFLKTFVSGKSKHTVRAYARVCDEFTAFIHPRPLSGARLNDLQDFVAFGRSPASRGQRSAVVRSLFAFGLKTGYLQAHLGAFLPKTPQTSDLTKRYLTEEEVMRMITLTENPRDRVILKLLYSSGMRVSELCALSWGDVSDRPEGEAALAIFGKGKKLRHVVVSVGVWDDLKNLKGAGTGIEEEPRRSDPVFVSQRKTRISDRMVRLIIRRAAFRAGIVRAVSPHWLRHAHASHALDRGAPIHLVQATLGHSSVATTGRYLHARPRESSGKYLGI